jgi:hypothetical protein
MNTRKTSIDCYHEIKENELLTKRRFQVYEAIYKNAPCTTNEALKDVYSGSHGVGSRTTELRDLGVIYEKGTKKCSVTGRNVIEWDLTDNIPIERKPPLTKKNRIAIAINGLRELYKNKNKLTDHKWKSVAALINDI